MAIKSATDDDRTALKVAAREIWTATKRGQWGPDDIQHYLETMPRPLTADEIELRRLRKAFGMIRDITQAPDFYGHDRMVRGFSRSCACTTTASWRRNDF